MRSAQVLPSVLLMAAALATRAAEPQPLTPSQIEDLAKQLGDEEHAKRDQATEALIAAGPVAVDTLRKAASSADAETAQRAKAVLVEIVDKPALAKRKDIVRLRDGGPRTEGHRVLGDAEAWKAWIATCTSEDLRRQLDSLKIDFGHEMLLVAAEGPSRSLLAKFEAEESGIRGIHAKPDEWEVEVTAVTSDKQSNTDMYPVYLTRVPRTDKRVEFRVVKKASGE